MEYKVWKKPCFIKQLLILIQVESMSQMLNDNTHRNYAVAHGNVQVQTMEV